jgi:YgiT-type zinc finger domain-containing protein
MRSKSKHQNQCAVCGGTLKSTTLTHEERRGDQLYLFQNVPAQVCAACGEIWIGEAVLREIDELIESGEPVREVKTPVFDFASTSDLLK